MIEKEFNEICSFRKNIPPVKGSPIPTNSPILRPVISNLISLRDKLESIFKNYNGIDLKFEYSKGASNFPNVAHVSILPPQQRVSNGIYVVICFDRFGRGALVGCAESKTNPKGLDVVYRKRSNKDQLAIDVDGGTENTSYNNTFANPEEFYYKLTNDIDLINHIRKSLDLVFFKLNFTKGEKLSIRQLVTSNTLYTQFDPKNIEDARKKIARQISVRQGQPAFKKELLEAYEFQCAISRCKIQELLEAAHIIPYKGKHTNHVQNGILLRADFHTLFDFHLISIDPKTMTVMVHNSLKGSGYYNYHGQRLHIPKRKELQPSKEALEIRQKLLSE